MPTYYRTLREANKERQIEWDKNDVTTATYAGNELAGEMGEALYACFLGDKAPDEIADELADVAICLDLVALRFGIPLPVRAIREDQRIAPSMMQGFCLGLAVGAICNSVKKLERAKLGMVGSTSSVDDLAVPLRNAMFLCAQLADSFGVDLNKAIAAKFNKTSMANGLTIFMEHCDG